MRLNQFGKGLEWMRSTKANQPQKSTVERLIDFDRKL
jgi:hypothetical protein